MYFYSAESYLGADRATSYGTIIMRDDRDIIETIERIRRKFEEKYRDNMHIIALNPL